MGWRQKDNQAPRKTSRTGESGAKHFGLDGAAVCDPMDLFGQIKWRKRLVT